MVREPNARMCGRGCEPALRHPQTVCILFAEKQNLLVFCANTKRTGCAGCLFHAPGVLCLPQVCEKLINCAPHANRAAREWHARIYKALVSKTNFIGKRKNRIQVKIFAEIERNTIQELIPKI